MGTNYDSPDNLQFNAGDIIFTKEKAILVQMALLEERIGLD